MGIGDGLDHAAVVPDRHARRRPRARPAPPRRWSTTSQQVGGAIGTALLNTLAATAATAYVADHPPATPDVIAAGAIHRFSVAYTWSAGIFLLGAVLTATLFRTRADRAARLVAAAPATRGEAPVLAH